MRADWHPTLACPRQAVQPMIKRGMARRRRNEGVDARQFLFLDIDRDLAHDLGRAREVRPLGENLCEYTHPHLTSVPFHIVTEEVQERNL